MGADLGRAHDVFEEVGGCGVEVCGCGGGGYGCGWGFGGEMRGMGWSGVVEVHFGDSSGGPGLFV